MLKSLFGELNPPDRPPADAAAPAQAFAATAILESVATEVNELGQMVDRHVRDLVVTGSPAQAIREHFAETRSDLDTASRLITLLDPMGVWASAVIKALSDAGGQPVERLHLRENTTLRTLAVIERTTLVRRMEDPLKIVHADVRAPGPDNAEIPVALMERSHMTTVIVGPMQPHAVEAMLNSLREAAALPTWRCPNLLFMLPPGALWIANKIAAVAWPQPLEVHVLNEPMTSASAVWNAMLGMWNQVKLRAAPAWPGAAPAGPETPEATPQALRVSRGALDPVRARMALAEMLGLDGLLGCALVEEATGLLVAREVADGAAVDLERVAASCAQALRAHRQAARNMGQAEAIDEVITTAGPRQNVMRTVAGRPELFLVALLDRHRTNLALARFKLADVERSLG
jgi:predicted regulator of Ras-like GTPase activity (Roadblock/LC7/MglB family)